MDRNNLSRTTILEKVKYGELSPERGLAMMKTILREKNGAASEISTLYYSPFWEKSDLKPNSESIGLADVIVFTEAGFANSGFFAPNPSINFIYVNKGKDFVHREKNCFEMDYAERKHYNRLFSELNSEGVLPVKIVYLLSDEKFKADDTFLKTQLEKSIISLSYICTGIMEQKIRGKIEILYVYQCRDGLPEPPYAGISGFARTIRQENPDIVITPIEIEIFGNASFRETILDLQGLLLGEFDSASERHFGVRYEEKRRFVKKLKNIETVCEKTTAVKKNGVYVITGGAGRIGMVIAEHLARTAGARLVLTGRSELDSERKENIKKFESYGSEVIYIKSDVSNREGAETLVSDSLSRYGEINGIIHCAGTIKDSFLLKKTDDEIKSVIAPKVFGTVWLDELTKNLKLDFFALFSSTTAVFGNPGQSDYAYASAFMDSFAFYRNALTAKGERSGKCVSINWPLWKDGGMGMEEKAVSMMWEKTGLSPLESAEGIKAFDECVNQSFANVVVLRGDRKKIQIWLDDQNKTGKKSTEDASKKTDRKHLNLKDSDARVKTEEFLKTLLSKEIQLPADRIQSQEPLEKYGIDSIMITSLNREFESYFGELSKTLLFEYRSVTELAGYFIENHYEKLLGIIAGTAAKNENKNNIEKKPVTIRDRFTAAKSLSRKNPSIDGDIAIIGVSGRYPMATDLDEFWENLKTGKDCITEIPSDRWDWKEYFDPDKNREGKSYSKWGGFIDGVDNFDPKFFNIAPREAVFLDPQERLFLETVWHSLEDAGYTRKALSESRVGVFAGVMYGHYQMFGAEESLKGNVVALSSSYASIANRISYYFDFNGPSMALDTMCSSSLTAIHLACESIKIGECDLAVAGGVNVTIHPNKYILLSQARFASSDGRCRSFGEGGDGYVPGEGVGAVLLKPVDKAISDGDNIYALIKGSSVNHGGKTNGYSVPNPKAQADVISETLKKSGTDPATISYVEAHGTGTSLGDPIEMTGLLKSFGSKVGTQFCPIGSVKSNIGHLESAAGIAGITKVLLQMRQKKLLPSIHSDVLNPNINFEKSPFYVQRDYSDWKKPVVDGKEYPRRAGLSSFGAGGSNAHIILEEYTDSDSSYGSDDVSECLFVLSAKNRDRLAEYASKLADFIERKILSKNSKRKNAKSSIEYGGFVIGAIADILQIDKNEIEKTVSLEEYGFKMIDFSRLAEKISEKFNLDVDVNDLMKKSTSEAIADMFLEIESGDFTSDNHSIDTTLMSMAYTLQTGREPMDSRLAIVASKMADLAESLRNFLRGEVDGKNLFAGEVKKGNEKNENSTMNNVEKLLKERRLNDLAELWVSGVDVDLRMLYQDAFPKKISLPVYPFAKEKYWFKGSSNDVDLNEKNRSVSLHPLVGVNKSTLRGQRYETRFSGKEPFLTGAALMGQNIFPEMLFMEMVRAAGEIAGEQKVGSIRNLKLEKIVTSDEAERGFQLTIYPANGYNFDVSLIDGSQLASGTLFYDFSGMDQKTTGSLDLDQIKKRCLNKVAISDFNEKISESGFEYDEYYKSVREICVGKEEALSRVELSLGVGKKDSDFTMHPSFLQGIFQTVAAISSMNAKETKPFFVSGMDFIEFNGDVPKNCYVHIVRRFNDTGHNDGSEKYDIIVSDVEGNTCMSMKGFSLGTKNLALELEKWRKNESKTLAPASLDVFLFDKIKSDIINFSSEVLGLEATDIDENTEFGEYGMESIGMIQLVNKLSAEYGGGFSPENVLEKNTVRKLAEYVFDVAGAHNEAEFDDSMNTMNRPEIRDLNETFEAVADSKLTDDEFAVLKNGNVFLNGVTGVLGGSLIKDFLEKTDCTLYCLVRAKDGKEALNRMRPFLEVYDPDKKLSRKFNERIVPVPGDITGPRLELDAKTYEGLADTIDMVVHNAGKISLHGSYNDVKAVNVDGTANMIDFALKTKNKYFVHVSTYAVAGDRQYKKCRPFTEEDFDLGQGFERMGYARSKFEAEKLVRLAGNEGLRWKIVRSGNIMGDGSHGRYPLGITKVPGLFYDYIKTAIDLGIAMESGMYFDISPVDYVSGGLVHIGTSVRDLYKTYHLVNPDVKTTDDVVEILNQCGFQVRLVSPQEYIKAISDKNNKYHSITTELMKFNPASVTTDGYSYASSDYTKKILGESGIVCPRVDKQLIETYLRYCVNIGYIKGVKVKKQSGKIKELA